MTVIEIHKANGLETNWRIRLSGLKKEFPNLSIDSSDILFESDAEKLFCGLRDTLPGGTMDRLLCKLLKYKSSHFIVSFNHVYDSEEDKK